MVDLRRAIDTLRGKEAALRAEYEGRLEELRRNIAMLEQALVVAEEALSDAPLVPQVSHSEAHPSSVPTRLTLWQADPAPPANVTPLPLLSPSGWRQKLRGLTQIEALERIARENGGILKTADAKPILMAAGLTRGKPRNIGSHIYHMLLNSENFERIGKGTFRLLTYRPHGEGETEERDAM